MPYAKKVPSFWGQQVPEHWLKCDYFYYKLSDSLAFASQCGQDVLLSIFFHLYQKSVRDVPLYWIDIGCNDGRTGNSTLLLEILHGRGLLVEPNYHLLGKVKECRKSPLLCCAVSDKSGITELLASDSVDTLSTICDGLSRSRLLHETSSKLYTIPVTTTTLGQIVEYAESLYTESRFGFLKIDAEGAEESICMQIEHLTVKPLVVEVENNYRCKALADTMLKCGYSVLTVMDSFVEIWVTDEMLDFAKNEVSIRFRSLVDRAMSDGRSSLVRVT